MAASHVLDITAPLTEWLTTWPEVVEPIERRVVVSPEDGGSMTVSVLELSAHAGTHVDAPNHFIDGAGGIETVPLRSLVGPAQVVAIPEEVNLVTASVLDGANIPPGTSRLLLETRNSGWSREPGEFRKDYVACDESAAEWIAVHGIVLLGVDYLSIEPFDADARGYPVHRVLLEAGVTIVESLDLAGVEPGTYELAVLPLLVPGSDAAPARAVLLTED